ncbi:molybdopterin molybdotransferase MoeA [Candidatus Thiosymbion oneisti]|uniref:molybdopterin molybdotransferase MoeA n=1 Tax=Candidatus Thiosymbion oneisti TaxID=589554 RepID=UPI000B7E06AC|nr:gephyrin-like molybdotransferase Glp [Candidatus Thiosymbion oneisti]
MTTHNDCSEISRSQLSVEEALELLLAQSRPIADSERVPTRSGLGRVLAESVVSTIDVPGWDNSAMDGYAVRSADLAASGGRLPVSQRIPAGVVGPPLESGTAARIFTGAPVPAGADTVVIQESCTIDGDWVQVPPDIEAGANIRRTGEDIAAGSQVIPAGIRLRAQHLGLAASVGAAELTVCRRLRVAVFSSGDELVMPGTPLGPGQIYNSNRFTLIGLLEELGCEVRDLGIVRDTLDATMEALAEAAERSDLILASGGVSVGEEDHVKPAVERLGSLDLWQIAMRPGKPLAFGHLGAARTPFIGSPGNPVSLFVTFCLFARPFIRRMQGIVGSVRPAAVTAEVGFTWPRPAKRREFQRARLEPDKDSRPRLSLYPNPSSAVLSSVAWANGLAVIPEGRVLKAGDPIEFIPFSELTG